MNIAAYFANKCFEFLLSEEAGKKKETQESNRSAIDSPVFPPPWIPDIDIFEELCDGCGKCIASCENNVLVLDKEGYPRIDFTRNFCSFCGSCAESCPQDIFHYGQSVSPWNLKACITLDCLTHNNVLCRTCVEHCEEEAIIVPKPNGSISTPIILEEKCNGCGGCFIPCPVRAINIINLAGSKNHTRGGER